MRWRSKWFSEQALLLQPELCEMSQLLFYLCIEGVDKPNHTQLLVPVGHRNRVL